jgi:hypothetical protein
MTANKAYFMVRAQVANEVDRAKFDDWYGTHHVPLAMEKLRAEKAWRYWSRNDPAVHYALYQFGDIGTLRSRIESPDSSSSSLTSTNRGRRCRAAAT